MSKETRSPSPKGDEVGFKSKKTGISGKLAMTGSSGESSKREESIDLTVVFIIETESR